MNRHLLLLFTFYIVHSTSIPAQQPLRIQSDTYTPDPAPVVSGKRLYVFTGCDMDTATYFRMPQWQVFSTRDMKHWRREGRPMTTAVFQWARQGDNAWASQAIERNGRWYWYVAAEDTTNHLHGIGVATAQQPSGPWKDAIGRPLIPGAMGFIDPTVFIDDDGQAYLFWGNNGLWYAKLNEDMTSIDTTFGTGGIRDMRQMLDDEAQFGPRRMKHDWQLNKKVLKTNFEEAPWVYKIGDTYYLEYAAGGVPEHWAYSTAKSIHGPWTYQGRITDESPGSFTIHGGTVDFRGKSYLFYHDGLLSGGNGFRRSTAIREFQRKANGGIPFININQ
ncbi:MAG: family 43 glycosylhydrolase [Bacteroidaceae bacterium]|nr:family 43 glycosylhydrolase [Bacteroidaceae bacterium]